MNIYLLFMLWQIGEDPEYVATQSPIRTAPRISEFITEDGSSKYMIFVEQQVLCETGSMTKAIYLWFASYYVFHLCYDSTVMDVCLFFQEFVFGLPCTTKRSSSYLSTATDIQRLSSR